MEPQQKSRSMVFVLVVSAIFLAIATFLTIILVTSRSSPPEIAPEIQIPVGQPLVYTVNGVQIVVNIDPNKAIRLEGEPLPAVPQPDQNLVPTATFTSIPPGPTFTPVPLPTATRPEPIIFIPYTVVAGDTLYSIANAQNSSVALIARHGYDANDLTPGNVLQRLPVANPAYCTNSRAYVVRDHDTVFRIAAQFGTTVEAIASLNNLGPDYRIEMTSVICIPG